MKYTTNQTNTRIKRKKKERKRNESKSTFPSAKHFHQTGYVHTFSHENGVPETVPDHEMSDLRRVWQLGRHPDAIRTIHTGLRYARKQRQRSQENATKERNTIVPA